MNKFGKGKIKSRIKAYLILQHLTSSKVELLYKISFSALRWMKKFLRSTLHRDKMKTLALLFIENKFIESISFDGIVE